MGNGKDTHGEQAIEKNQSVLQNIPTSVSLPAAGFTIAPLHLVSLSSGLCTQWFLNCSEMAQLEMALDSYVTTP